MAIKYFSDAENGPVELGRIFNIANSEFAIRFPGITGKRYDSFSKFVGLRTGGDAKTLFPVTRMIEFKSNPSRHVCDDRCTHARGRVMKCECSCGGANHGKAA